jgi:hypothetical protein
MILQVLLKPDIGPLCDIHHVEMNCGLLQTSKPDPFLSGSWLVYKCSVPECARIFDKEGYIDFIDGVLVAESKNSVRCEHAAMFIESVSEMHLIWRCCCVGCERSKTTGHEPHEAAFSDKFMKHLGAISGPKDLSTRKGFSKS